MKKIIVILLSVLLFTACNREPIKIKTETRVYELTFIDGKTFVYKFNDVDVNAEDGIDHNRGGYFFYIFSNKTYEHVEAVIRFKRIK